MDCDNQYRILLETFKSQGFILANGKCNPQAKRNLEKYPFLKQQLIELFPFYNYDIRFSQYVYALKHELKELPLCPVCNTPIKFDEVTIEYPQTCSRTCASNHEATKHKRQQTNLEKYGSINPLSNKDVQSKRQQTNLEKYGSEHILQTDSGQNKRKQTLIKKFGTSNTNQVESVVQKRHQTCLDKYGTKFSSQRHWSPETHEKINDINWLTDQHYTQKKPLYVIASELNISDKILGDHLHKFGLDTKTFSCSAGEQEIYDFLLTLLSENDIVQHDRSSIKPYELDIFIPSISLGIEYCGLYWHSEKFKDRYYHKQKYQMCATQNIKLLTIYEDEWYNSKDIIKNKLRYLLNRHNNKIPARKCNIEIIDTSTKQSFFSDYHIQGSGPGSINYGLVFNNELVACMSFIEKANNVYVLNRYATKHVVVGGFNKLLSYFKNTHRWKQIITFADLRWSDGQLYHSSNFKLVSILLPDYYYVVNNKRYHKFNFRRKYLPTKLDVFDPELSEWENCKANNIDRIWDCGKLRFCVDNIDE